MTTKNVNEIKIGDVVMPPKRELNLWMRKRVKENNLPESALHLTVKSISERTDKRGKWLIFKTQYPEVWGHTSTFTFKTLESSQWPIIL